jgi:hypothetical protein
MDLRDDVSEHISVIGTRTPLPPGRRTYPKEDAELLVDDWSSCPNVNVRNLKGIAFPCQRLSLPKTMSIFGGYKQCLSGHKKEKFSFDRRNISEWRSFFVLYNNLIKLKNPVINKKAPLAGPCLTRHFLAISCKIFSRFPSVRQRRTMAGGALDNRQLSLPSRPLALAYSGLQRVFR